MISIIRVTFRFLDPFLTLGNLVVQNRSDPARKKVPTALWAVKC